MKIAWLQDRSGSQIDHEEVEWDAAAKRFLNPPEFPSKAACHLFTLCEFGDKPTLNGSFRSNDNVVALHGVVVDYDGERITPEQAAEELKSANIRGLVYTTSSHTDERPYWRIVCPYDVPVIGNDAAHDAHRVTCERLNSLLGGALSMESFTLSQSYYFGRLPGKTFRAVRLDGRNILSALELQRVPWRGAQRTDGSYRVETSALLAELEAGESVHPAIVMLAARGYGQEELTDVVSANCANWSRPDRAKTAIEQDIPRAVNSIRDKRQRELERKLAALPPPPQYLPPVRAKRLRLAAELLHEPKPVVWLVRDMIEHPCVAELFGEPGAGKSFLALQWAACVATGAPWNGRETLCGPVVYIAGEGFSGLRRRIKAWAMHTGVSLLSAPLWVSERAIPLTSPDQLQGLYEDIAELPQRPALIVIDTLTRMTPGMDQNSPRDMGQFVGLCDAIKEAYGCTVLIIHHSGHGDKMRGKGAVDLKGALDMEAGLMKHGDNGARLVSTKVKDGEPFDPMYFKFQTVELPWLENPSAGPTEIPRKQTSAMLVLTDKPAGSAVAGPAVAGSTLSKSQQVVREILRDGRARTRHEVRDEFCRLYEGSRETAVKAFNRAVKAYLDTSFIVLDKETDELRAAFA